MCLELEGLYEKYGDGTLDNKDQEQFRYDLVRQAEKGLLSPDEVVRKRGSFRDCQARPLETWLVRMAEW